MANEAPQQKSRRVRMIWLVAAGIIVLVIALSMIPKAIEADIVRADRGNVRVEIIDEGRTRMHDIYVISAPVTGRVLRVDVEPGDTVEAGAVLARMSSAAAGFLDTRTADQARATVRAAEAQRRSSEAQLTLAQREQSRNENLVRDKVVPQSVADETRARLKAAQAAFDAAKAEVARARSALVQADKTGGNLIAVVSPSVGQVLRVPQESESVIAAGTPIVEVGDPRHIEVIAEFLSQDAVRMQPGASAEIVNWGGPALQATVDRIEPIAHTKISALGVEEQRTNVILQFGAGASGYPRAQDFRVDARVLIDQAPNAVRVPLGALFRHGENWALYKVVGGRAKLTEVHAAQTDGRYRAIASGVDANDEIIVFPSSTIADGARVKRRKSDR
jgi:HlyD family secretion protein